MNHFFGLVPSTIKSNKGVTGRLLYWIKGIEY